VALEAGGWLADPALVYLEHPAGAPPPLPAHWQRLKLARVGEVEGALWQRRAPATEPGSGSGKLAGALPEPGGPST
jgi:hypothetical protein